MTETGYPSKLVAAVTGLSLRQLDYYDRISLISPSVQKAGGHGSRRRYGFRDIVELRTLAVLRKDVSLQKIRASVIYLRQHFPDVNSPLAELRFITNGSTIFVLTRDPQVILDTLKQGQMVIHLAFGEIIESTRTILERNRTSLTESLEVRGQIFTIDYHPDEDSGFFVTCREIKGAVSEGETIEEAREMITDALSLVLDVLSQNRPAALRG